MKSLYMRQQAAVWLSALAMFSLVGCASRMAAGGSGYPLVCSDFVSTNESESEFEAEIEDHLDDSYLENRTLWNTFDKKFDGAVPRKLVVFMDGTNNDKSSSTNVRKLYLLSVRQACEGSRIIPYYDKGVGAKWFDMIRGGYLGWGVSLNIRQAYRFLATAFRPGDEIYLIGFSRGAFTARSLNGFIEFAGLLDGREVKAWYDSPWVPFPGFTKLHFLVSSLYDEYKSTYDGTPNFDEELKAKLKMYRDGTGLKFHEAAEVTAIGVFDTVPALGWLNDDEPDNHRIDLYAKYGFHALSLDEQRDQFRLLRFDQLRASVDRKLSEVWFAGVHSDVGGGYSLKFNCVTDKKSDRDYGKGLATAPLNWMIRSFERFGIFPQFKNAKGYRECSNGVLHDEYFGHTSWVFQRLGTFRRSPRKGDVIHRSVVERINLPKLIHDESSVLANEVHNKREPGGKYHFMGLSGSAALERFFPCLTSDIDGCSSKVFEVFPFEGKVE